MGIVGKGWVIKSPHEDWKERSAGWKMKSGKLDIGNGLNGDC